MNDEASPLREACNDDWELESTFSEVIRVLIAEDSVSQRLVVQRHVRSLGLDVFGAKDGQQALEMIREHRPHILITDWEMPKLDGIQLCKLARESDRERMLYIIVLTAHGNEDRLVEAFEAGADDYLSKPLNPRELQARLRAGRRIVALQKELRRNAQNLRAANLELTTANRRLYDIAHLDSLTGLPNRRFIVERLQQEFASYLRKRKPISVILLDVDNFKRVNDQFGHDIGDEVLVRVGKVLRAQTRASDVISRFGGEEFLIVSPDTDIDSAMHLAERVRIGIMREQFDIDGWSWTVTASLGVARADSDTQAWDDVVRKADKALYRAKGEGKNCVCSWSPNKMDGVV